LADVARVEIAPEDVRRIARFNGSPAVALGVIKTSTANPLEVSQEVRAELPRIEKSLPDGMQVRLAYDSSVFIQESINSYNVPFLSRLS
jgi:multidrug efflux pump